MLSSPKALLHDALVHGRYATQLISRAHIDTKCDDRLTSIFKTSISLSGRSCLVVRDLDNYLRNRFTGNFEPFYSCFFLELEKSETELLNEG
jgi:hypothetical protein